MLRSENSDNLKRIVVTR